MSESAAAPVEATPVATTEAVATPAPETAPVAAEAPPAAVESAAQPTEPVAEPSLIAEAPAEPVAAEPAAEPVEVAPITYEPFVLPESAPEGFRLDDAELKPFTEILGQHQVPQAAAQALFDQYVALQQNAAKAAYDKQVAAWESLKVARHKEFDSDPDMGGAKKDQTLASVRDALDRFGGTADQVKALRTELLASGASELPGLVRLINNMAQRLSEGRPVAAIGARAPAAPSSSATRYRNSPSMPRSS